ncbi:MAG TPA: BrnT family toxin [Polyangiales bacterium]
MADLPENLAECTGFQWDSGNSEKNWELHRVSRAEAEQVFFNRPILVAVDGKHSQQELRYAALGQTNEGRRLMLVFTVRENLVRVISVRDQSREERKVYEQAETEK